MNSFIEKWIGNSEWRRDRFVLVFLLCVIVLPVVLFVLVDPAHLPHLASSFHRHL